MKQQRTTSTAGHGHGSKAPGVSGAVPTAAGIPVREEALGPPGTMGRRAALKLMAASTLLAAGGAGCHRKPHRKIVSMVEMPEYQQPGIPVYYASTWTEGHTPYGMMIKAVDGRPIKIEGLPDHPLNRGASSAPMQASILSLYDPERLRGPHHGDKEITWDEADRRVAAALRKADSVLLVTRATLGPAERALVDRFLAACPAARHLVHEAVADGPRRNVWRAVYGADGEVRPQLARARVILSLDADFLGTDGAVLEATHDFAATRTLAGGKHIAANLSRLYVVESAMTVTGSNADHRIPLRPSAMLDLVQALRAARQGKGHVLQEYAVRQDLDPKLLAAMAEDLATHGSAAVVLAGSHLPEAVHAAVCLLNADLGAPGTTLAWNPAPAMLPVSSPSEIEAAATRNGGADVVVFLGVNPAHDWPPKRLQKIIGKAGLVVGHGLYRNETLAACSLALPSSHNLESWNDAAPAPGLRTVCQPVIAPLFNARQEAESLLVWTQQLVPDDADLAACPDWHAFLRAEWQKDVVAGAPDPTRAWEDVLRRGMAGKVVAENFPKLDRDRAAALAAKRLPTTGGLELVILPAHALLDGRFATNAWLEELPDPVTKLVWDNAAIIGRETAERLGVAENDVLAVQTRGPGDGHHETLLPVLVQPGVADGVVATALGYGRTHGGAAGTAVGVNVAPLMGACGVPLAPRLAVGVTVRRVANDRAGKPAQLVRTQQIFSMMGRPIVRHGTRAEYEADPEFARKRSHVPELDQLDIEYDYSHGAKWAMAIDLGACTGCSACMIACQAENNIPVVGKHECSQGREMHWIRIDRYEEGDPTNPHVYQQPMLCQQCDNAPCESVCPVNATTHSDEGLNQQVYNRCVGTRYCANNCPYKVRRFNFFNYQGRILKDSVQELVFNPQVTVRSRGVMEKCTFCIQRINAVKFQRENAGQQIPDGAILPACAQACPAQAIVFGDVNDVKSEVATRRASSLAYAVLEELNVRPNVAYLARVTNPHPAVSAVSAAAKGGHG